MYSILAAFPLEFSPTFLSWNYKYHYLHGYFPCSIIDATYCLHLHYHMYGGNTMGKFSIMTYSNENGYNLCAEVNGNQGEIWHHLLVELDLNSSTRVRSCGNGMASFKEGKVTVYET